MYSAYYLKKSNRSEFLLLTGEGRIGLNHLRYWIPELIKAQVKFSVLVRHEEVFKLLKQEYRTLNVLLAKTAMDIEATLANLHSLKAIFFMSNPANNIHVLRFNKYRHIFLGSENSDRDAQVTKVLRAYDELWVSSQSSIDKLKSKIEIGQLTIKKIGKPQLKDIATSPQIKKTKSVLLLVSSDSNLYSNSNVLTKILSSIPKEYYLEIVLEQSLSNKNVLFKDLRMQLNEFNLLVNRNFTIYYSYNDNLLSGKEYIICDTNNYQQKFIKENALVCLYTPKNISPESLFHEKYISFECIPQFSDNKELKDIFSQYEYLISKQRDFSEYWLGTSYTLENEFLKNLRRLSSN